MLKKRLILTSLCFLMLFITGHPGHVQKWSGQNSGVTSHLFTINFINDSHGYAAGDSGVILKTTNGGLNWTRMNSPTNQPISSIFFVNRDTGWVGGNQGIIFKTTNGGSGWIQQNSKTVLDISSLYFLNERLGWGVTLTGNPVYLVTTNGGAVWDTVKRSGFPINSIMFIDSLKGFACGGRFDWLGFVNYSVDGGWNWTTPQSVDLEVMFDVNFMNKQSGITVGGDHDFFGSLAYQTFNGGKTWLRQSVTDSVPSPLMAISLLDSAHAWACGYGKIYQINPFLQLWNLMPDTLTKWVWYDLSFVNKDLGWFAGAYGKILHYDNTPVSVDEETPITNKFILQPNYPNPFNPSTTIRCLVGEAAHAELTIFNVLGQSVKTLFSGRLTAGEHHWIWYGTNEHNHYVGSGIYVYQLKINHRVVNSRKMILIR